MSEPVKTRLVLSFPGFEPVPVEAHRRRFEREPRPRRQPEERPAAEQQAQNF